MVLALTPGVRHKLVFLSSDLTPYMITAWDRPVKNFFLIISMLYQIYPDDAQILYTTCHNKWDPKRMISLVILKMNPIQRESYKTKYITMYANSEECKSNFQNDIASKNIFDRINKDLHADPNVNYKILESEISCSMNYHMKKNL